HPGIVDETAIARDLPEERVLEEIHRDLMRRGHRRLGLRQRLANEFDRPWSLAGAAVEIALERRVEQHGGDVPDDDQPGEDDEYGHDAVAEAGHGSDPFPPP